MVRDAARDCLIFHLSAVIGPITLLVSSPHLLLPGTGCTEYLQEAAAYGPSTGQSVRTLPGVGFDTSMCRTEFLNKMNCTADPEEEPIFSEFPPTTAALPIDKVI